MNLESNFGLAWFDSHKVNYCYMVEPLSQLKKARNLGFNIAIEFDRVLEHQSRQMQDQMNMDHSDRNSSR